MKEQHNKTKTMRTTINTDHFYRLATQFADHASAATSDLGIDVSAYPIDHICYRVQTLPDYERLKGFLQEQGILLSEAIINKRPIATVKLHIPIPHETGTIPCVELPSPKPERPYPEGFEHVEYVVPSISALAAQFPHLSLRREEYGPFNPTLSLRIDDFTVKFHERSLEYVIALEQQQV